MTINLMFCLLEIDPNTRFIVMPNGKQAVMVPNQMVFPENTYKTYYEKQQYVTGQGAMVKWEKTSMSPAGQQRQYYYDYQKVTPGGVQYEHREEKMYVVNQLPPPPMMYFQTHEVYNWNAANNYNQNNMRIIQQNIHQVHQAPKHVQPLTGGQTHVRMTPQQQMEAIRRRFEEIHRAMTNGNATVQTKQKK